MIQTGLIPNAHNDLVTDAVYDFYGLKLATCGLDQRYVYLRDPRIYGIDNVPARLSFAFIVFALERIKIWQLDETNGTWSVEDDWKAHDATISKLSWAHPEFGTVIASAGFDRVVKVWERVGSAGVGASEQLQQPGGSSTGPSSSRWTERAVLADARGTVRAVEFAPHQLGLKLATISSDSILRVYECVDHSTLATWQHHEDIDIINLVPGPSPSHVTRAQTVALATPTQTIPSMGNASLLDGASQALQQQQQQSTGPARSGVGNREADGGWTLSWCKDRYWGDVIAVGAGTSGVVKIIEVNSRGSKVLLTLEPQSSVPLALGGRSFNLQPPPPGNTNATVGASAEVIPPAGSTSAVTSVSWAPSCGRSYHLVATGSRDGHVRIWKVRPPPDDVDDGELSQHGVGGQWTATAVADFDQHKSAVGRVEWNVTGTVLSSAGNDGRIRLWKATVGNVWRPAGSIGVEQASAAEESKDGLKDVEMAS